MVQVVASNSEYRCRCSILFPAGLNLSKNPVISNDPSVFLSSRGFLAYLSSAVSQCSESNHERWEAFKKKRNQEFVLFCLLYPFFI